MSFLDKKILISANIATGGIKMATKKLKMSELKKIIKEELETVMENFQDEKKEYWAVSNQLSTAQLFEIAGDKLTPTSQLRDDYIEELRNSKTEMVRIALQKAQEDTPAGGMIQTKNPAGDAVIFDANTGGRYPFVLKNMTMQEISSLGQATKMYVVKNEKDLEDMNVINSGQRFL